MGEATWSVVTWVWSRGWVRPHGCVVTLKLCISKPILLTTPTSSSPGTPALTSRGMKEADIEQVAAFIEEGVAITIAAQKGCEAMVRTAATPTAGLKIFKDFLLSDEGTKKAIDDLRTRVEAWADKFPIPGFDDQ